MSFEWKKLRPEKLESIAECDEAMVQLDLVINEIQHQIDTAKAGVISGGEYSDPYWFADTKQALKACKAKRQQVQNHKGEISRMLKNNKQATAESMFIDQARKMLPPETYRSIWDKVNALLGGA